MDKHNHPVIGYVAQILSFIVLLFAAENFWAALSFSGMKVSVIAFLPFYLLFLIFVVIAFVFYLVYIKKYGMTLTEQAALIVCCCELGIAVSLLGPIIVYIIKLFLK